jgi:hypothetical protein
MGKYIGDNKTGSNSGKTSAACADYGGAAVAFDPEGKDKRGLPIQSGCWRLTGKAVEIGDKTMTVQAGFEVINFNFHVKGTQAAVASSFGLPGSVA